ncbi:YaiI/YqxD family protein [Anaerosporobacter faecicola]|uniref:YaiI/YqxD family protein n=1 Tax=Anaerosporobacter faecicola TaxID=2718714 RepID=UPI0014391E8D|nr:YaiI/YqxD family protein [Anaerosporobacter faecicola]
MKILVDADACPVRLIIEKVAKELSIPVIMIIDTSHILESDYSEIVHVSKAPDAVDIALINRTNEGDIAVTQDYGVATMVLGKKGYAINQNGRVYTNENIDLLMFERHIAKKQRRAGVRTSSIRKRTKEDNDRFEYSFRKLCKLALSRQSDSSNS